MSYWTSQSLEKVASCCPCEQFENWKRLENILLLSVWKDGILEIDSMRQEVIVLIHPNGKKGGKSCRLDTHGVCHVELRINRRL